MCRFVGCFVLWVWSCGRVVAPGGQLAAVSPCCVGQVLLISTFSLFFLVGLSCLPRAIKDRFAYCSVASLASKHLAVRAGAAVRVPPGDFIAAYYSIRTVTLPASVPSFKQCYFGVIVDMYEVRYLGLSVTCYCIPFVGNCCITRNSLCAEIRRSSAYVFPFAIHWSPFSYHRSP